MGWGWDLIWTLYHKITPNLISAGNFFDTDIPAMSIHLNEDLSEVYYKTLPIQNSIYLSKAIISLNVFINKHLELFMY